MKTALFINFTDQEFTGWWDGKGKKFPPGASLYMPDYLAKHFAKHLVNRELLRTDNDGNLIHKNGDKFTSPKKPEQVPVFMELFNKAYIPDETEEMGGGKDDIDALIGAANKNREARINRSTAQVVDIPKEKTDREIERDEQSSQTQDPTKPQVIPLPEGDEDDEDGFEGNNSPEAKSNVS